MRKENIPFIFKYLMRWVPGLRIDSNSSGDTPTPVVEDLFEEGDLLFYLYFNVDRDIFEDLKKLDFSNAPNATSDGNILEHSYILPLLTLTIPEKGEDKTSFMQLDVIKFGAGDEIDGHTLTEECYCLFCGTDSSTNPEDIDKPLDLERLGDLLCWADSKFISQTGISLDTSLGWVTASEGFYLISEVEGWLTDMAFGIECDKETGEGSVGPDDGLIIHKVEQQNIWKIFISKMPFVRKDIEDIHPYFLNILSYNASSTPDLSEINWTISNESGVQELYGRDSDHGEHDPYRPGEQVGLICPLITYQGSALDKHIAALKLDVENNQSAYALVKKEGSSDMGTIWCDSLAVPVVQGLGYKDPEINEDGWFPDSIEDEFGNSSDWYIMHAESMKAFAGLSDSNQPEFYQYETWKKWIDAYPFK